MARTKQTAKRVRKRGRSTTRNYQYNAPRSSLQSLEFSTPPRERTIRLDNKKRSQRRHDAVRNQLNDMERRLSKIEQAHVAFLAEVALKATAIDLTQEDSEETRSEVEEWNPIMILCLDLMTQRRRVEHQPEQWAKDLFNWRSHIQWSWQNMTSLFPQLCKLWEIAEMLYLRN